MKKQYFVTIIFVILFLPMLGMVTKIGTQSPQDFRRTEKRVQKELPNKINKNIFKNLEAFYNDHYAGRGFFLTSLAKIKFYFFNKSLNEKKVIIGKNGYFFAGNDINDVLKTYSIDYSKDITLIQKQLDQINTSLKSKNKKFVFILIPNKHSIYPSLLPSFYSESMRIQNGFNLSSSLPDDYSVNLFDFYKKIPQEDYYKLYHKTDTHWSNFGSLVAYKQLLSLENNQPFFTNFESPKVRKSPGYDLSGMSKLPIETITDFQISPKVNYNLNNFIVTNLKNNEVVKGLKNLKTRRDHFYHIKNLTKENKKILILKDSFYTSFQAHGIYNEYSDVVVLHWKGLASKKNREILKNYDFNTVSFIMVERYLPIAKHSLKNLIKFINNESK